MISQRAPSRLLGLVGGLGCEVAEDAGSGAEHLDTRDRIDRRSDAEWHEAIRLARDLERLCPQVAGMARQIVARAELGLEIDELENGHCDEARLAHQRNEDRGRQQVTALRAYALPGGTGGTE